MSDAPADEPLSEAARRAKSGLSDSADEGGRMQADLEQALADKLMARSDVGADVTRELEASASLMLPSIADIDQTLKSAEVQLPESQQEIERLLSLDAIGDGVVQGKLLNELLERGASTIEERNILKRGLLFLRRRMYAEATEWWTLNCPNDTSAFHVLLKLLLALTYKLAGNDALAEKVIAEVRAKRSSIKK